jgi:signal peptidase
VDDRALYDENQIWLHKKDLMGKIEGLIFILVIKSYLPYMGMVTIILNDYPLLKWTLLAFMSIMVLFAKDPQS